MPYRLALLHKLARNLRNNFNDDYDSPQSRPKSPLARLGFGLGYRLYLGHHTICNNETVLFGVPGGVPPPPGGHRDSTGGRTGRAGGSIAQ